MNTMKAVIVDDEARNRQMLQKLLELFCPEVAVAGNADSVTTAVKAIKELKPDIVFLDIELHPEKCFDIFPQLDSLDFEVIFTTAHKGYAIEAIKHGALDYLLKPVGPEELQKAVNKAVQKRSTREDNSLLAKFIREMKPAGPSRIGLPTNDGIIYAETDNIRRCEAKGPYTNIFFKDGNKVMTSRNLKEYELQLPGSNFMRVHNSHLINLAEVKMYVKTDGGYIEMKDGTQVPLSQSQKESFFEKMKG